MEHMGMRSPYAAVSNIYNVEIDIVSTLGQQGFCENPSGKFGAHISNNSWAFRRRSEFSLYRTERE